MSLTAVWLVMLISPLCQGWIVIAAVTTVQPALGTALTSSAVSAHPVAATATTSGSTEVVMRAVSAVGRRISSSVLNTRRNAGTRLESSSTTILTNATDLKLYQNLVRNRTASNDAGLEPGSLLTSLLVPVVNQNRECHVHIVYDQYYSSQLVKFAAEIHLQLGSVSVQVGSRISELVLLISFSFSLLIWLAYCDVKHDFSVNIFFVDLSG